MGLATGRAVVIHPSYSPRSSASGMPNACGVVPAQIYFSPGRKSRANGADLDIESLSAISGEMTVGFYSSHMSFRTSTNLVVKVHAGSVVALR